MGIGSDEDGDDSKVKGPSSILKKSGGSVTKGGEAWGQPAQLGLASDPRPLDLKHLQAPRQRMAGIRKQCPGERTTLKPS